MSIISIKKKEGLYQNKVSLTFTQRLEYIKPTSMWKDDIFDTRNDQNQSTDFRRPDRKCLKKSQ